MNWQILSIEIEGTRYWYGATEHGEPITKGYLSKELAEHAATECVARADDDDLVTGRVYEPPAGGIYVEPYLGLE
jgi:hypothetical protein